VAEDRRDVEEGSWLPDSETPEEARRRADTRTWTEMYAAVPGRDSPFYSPPPSRRALRWLVAIYVGVFALFTVVIVAGILQSNSALMKIVLRLFWALYAWWRVYRIRTILKELARRRDDGSLSTGGQSRGVEDDLEAQKLQRRRKAAWERVAHDVFPLLSKPSAFKRPFREA
jgi:hypothetical protein